MQLLFNGAFHYVNGPIRKIFVVIYGQQFGGISLNGSCVQEYYLFPDSSSQLSSQQHS